MAADDADDITRYNVMMTTQPKKRPLQAESHGTYIARANRNFPLQPIINFMNICGLQAAIRSNRKSIISG